MGQLDIAVQQCHDNVQVHTTTILKDSRKSFDILPTFLMDLKDSRLHEPDYSNLPHKEYD